MARKKTAGRPSPYEFKSLRLAGSGRPARPITVENRGQGLQAAQQEAKRMLEEQYAAEDAAKAAAEAQANTKLQLAPTSLVRYTSAVNVSARERQLT